MWRARDRPVCVRIGGPEMRWFAGGPRGRNSSRPIPENRGTITVPRNWGMITGGVGSPVTRQRRIEVGELLRWPGVPPMAQFKDRDGNTFEIVEASG
jgi:hypothetical protein